VALSAEIALQPTCRRGLQERGDDIAWRHLGRLPWVVVSLHGKDRSRLLTFAGPGVIAYCILFPAVQIALIAETWGNGYEKAAWALGATACFLPLQVRLVRDAIRGTGRSDARWSLPLIAAAVLGAIPLVGPFWLPNLAAIGVSALLVLPTRPALVIVAAVLLAVTPIALAQDSPLSFALWFTGGVLYRGTSLFVLVQLVASMRRLQATRVALAEEAVVSERLRIDDELRETLGAALAAIVAGGERTASLLTTDAASAREELDCLVDRSRRTLADARNVINRFHVPPQVEIETAVSLLNAAGIRASIEGDVRDVDPADEAAARLELRSAVAQLLRHDDARSCIIRIGTERGRTRLEVIPTERSGTFEEAVAP
jgi:two-component system sensor histidine kinase DesK